MGGYDAYIYVKDGRVDKTVGVPAAEVYADLDEQGNILGIEIIDIYIDPQHKPKRQHKPK